MTRFVTEHRHAYGVEPICRVLQIAPSTYYNHAVRQADPERNPNRWWQDQGLAVEVRRVWDENRQVYGVRKVWRQLQREGWQVARCTVERLMRRLGLRGVIRGKVVKTTVSDKAQPCPLDRVNRQFHADRPNALWVSDFTYVSTWQGMVYVALVIDVYARRIVGWKVSSSMTTDFVLDALEQALHARQREGELIHHSDRGIQYAAEAYRSALARSGITPSMSRKGDCWDNAPMESFFHTLKTERVHHRVYATRDQARRDMFGYIEGFYNPHRLHSALGYISPAEAERKAA